MNSNIFRRIVAIMLSLITVISIMSVGITAEARYASDFNGTYEDLNCAEDDCDCLEPQDNNFAIVSPSSATNQYNTRIFTGTYQQVQDFLNDEGMTDGMPVIPPTWIKVEKFMRYTPYADNDVVATVNGRSVTAYQVAVNAIMSGASAEYLPVCIAFTKALGDADYLDSIRSGELTPMMYVNGPIARQLGIDNGQGMTTEECNISIARFMELALINLAGIDRSNAFGNVQPLVFSEDEQNCINIGWDPRHVEEGYDLNDNVITATSFSMWGNNVTPATDLPQEIMKVIAWDITEKNLGGLGSKSVEDNENTHRLIFITPSVASALAKKYKSKDALESALVENARRPLWMRTYAYYYANTGSALSKSFTDVYGELKESESAEKTASPPWMNGITYAEIDTVATMVKGNTDIIIHGDESRNKTQVMPGGVSVSKEIELDLNTWDTLLTSMSYQALDTYQISASDTETTVKLPDASGIPTELLVTKQTTYTVAASINYAKSQNRIFYDSASSTLYYGDGTTAHSVVLDTEKYADFIKLVESIGRNGTIKLNNKNTITAVGVAFKTNANFPDPNMVDYTDESFASAPLTIKAVSTTNSASLDGGFVTLSADLTSFTADLAGATTLVLGDSTAQGFVTVSGTTVTVDTTVEAGATAVIGADNGDGTYKTMTIVNGGDGTYSVTYNSANTLTLSASSYYLKGTFNDWGSTDAFEKTDNADILSIIKDIPAGTYTLKVHDAGSDTWYGNAGTFTDIANRWTMNSSENCTFKATGGIYEFKYEISTNKLSVYYAQTDAAATPTTKTVYVGVIEYITDFVPTLHYWNNSTDLLGDAILTATGETQKYSVGSAYWSNAAQNFKIYKTEVPVAANGMKTFRASNNDRWAIEEVNPTDDQIILVWEWNSGADYHNKLATRIVETPTEAPTQAPTQAPTPAPTEAPTEALTKYCEEGYYLVGALNGQECWTLESLADNAQDRKFVANEQVDGEYTLDYTFAQGDAIKVIYTDGYEILNWYNDGGDSYVISETEVGECTVYFNPDGNGNWDYEYIYVDGPEIPTEAPTQAPTHTPTEAPTEDPTEAPTHKTVYVGVVDHITDFTPTLHYWNSSGLAGDVALSKTGETKQFAVGSSYWNNAKQNFTIYKANIPVEATKIKTWDQANNNKWASEDVTYADGKILLLFEYSDVYHNVSQSFTPYAPPVPTTEDKITINFRLNADTAWVTNDDAKIFVNDGKNLVQMDESIDTKTGNVMWTAEVLKNTEYVFYRTSYYFDESNADEKPWDAWIAKSRADTNFMYVPTASGAGTWSTSAYLAADSADIENFWYGLWIDTQGEGNAQHAVRWHNTGSAYHLYVPSYVDLTNVNVYTSWDSFSIDGTSYSNGDAVNLSAGTHTLSSVTNNTTTNRGSFTVYQSKGTASMLMSTNEELFTGTTAANQNENAWPVGSGITADNYNGVYKDKIETKGSYYFYSEEGEQVNSDTVLKKIKGRGNSSFESSMQIYGKYAYNFNLDKKVALIKGSTESKKWCMLANNVDHTMMRNTFIYQLSDELNLAYGPETRLTDVFDNGKYMGSFIITEKVEYGSNTLMNGLENLDDANEEANTYTDANGKEVYKFDGDNEDLLVQKEAEYEVNGTTYTYQYTYSSDSLVPYDTPKDFKNYNYLLEHELYDRYKAEASWFVSERTGQAVVVKYPEFATQEEMKWIIAEYEAMEAAVYNDDYDTYSELIDVESFAKMYLIQELTINLDSGATSYYIYNKFAEDGSSKLVAGPVWDYDWSMGDYSTYKKYVINNTNGKLSVVDSGHMDNPNQMFVKNKALKSDAADTTKAVNYCLEAKLAQNTDFYTVCQSIWTNQMEGILDEYIKDSADDDGIIVDTYLDNFKPSVDMNNARWGVYTFTADTWGTKVTSNYTPYSYNFNIGSSASAGSATKCYSNTVYYLNDWLKIRRDYMSDANGGNLYVEDLLIKYVVSNVDFEAVQSEDNSTLTITPSATVTKDGVEISPSEYTYTVYVNGKAVTDAITFETESVDVTLPDGQKSEVYIVVTVIEDEKATQSSDVQTFAYGVVDVTVMFKSSSSYRYIPTLTVGDVEYTMTVTGDAIAMNSSQTQKYYWYTADIVVQAGASTKLLFANKYSMRAYGDLTNAVADKVYYFGCDNLNTGSVAVDLTDKDESVRNFVKSSTHMVKNDVTAAGIATTSLDGTIYKLGDADRDNKLTILDATTIQYALVKQTQLSDISADISDYDLDGRITILDVTSIQIYLVNN